MPQTKWGVSFSFLFALIISCFFPKVTSLDIHFFIPAIVMSFYIFSKTTSIWLAFLAGCFLDGLYVSLKLGFLGISYLVSAMLLYPYRVYFFKDSYSTLPLMTYFFSALMTGVQIIVAILFDMPHPPIRLSWIFSDCIIMPLVDAAFSFALFSLPCFLYTHYYKRRLQN